MHTVTIFENIVSIDSPKIVRIEAVLDAIRNGRYRSKIEAIRLCDNEDTKRSLKANLPCVLFTGEFNKPITKINASGKEYVSYRDDKSITKHSGLVPIDIDNVEDLDSAISELINDDIIYALWRSSSGKGLHGLVKIGDGNKHTEHYRALIKRIKGLDTTAQNVARVLYVSYDPNIYVNTSSSVFYDIDIEEEKQPSRLMYGDGHTDYKKVDIASRMIRSAPDGEKHHALLRAANLLGGYVATKNIEYDIAFNILSHEIRKRHIDDPKLADKTIEDGLRHGMARPISQVEQEFKEAVRELGAIEEELSFLTSNTSDDDFIYKFRKGLIPMGLPLGYHDLDQHFLLKEGEFYASLAHSHIGKTTINLWLLFLSAIKYDWNWMVYTGENRAASVKMKMMEFFVGKKIIHMDDREHAVSLKFVDEHFFMLSTDNLYTYKDIMDHSKVMMGYKSLKGLFIDPYNSLKLELTASKNKYNYDYEAYGDMLNYTKRYNTTLFLSVHTTTASQRDRDSSGSQKMPHASDTEGGAALYNKSDNFLTLHRKIKDPNEWMFTEVSVDKVRNRETGGKPTPYGSSVRLKMVNGIEFVDDYDNLPFNREQLLTKYKIL
jgi:hypothetical protein